MEDNKYYTPELEEFHLGFQYQHKCFNGWEDDTMPDFSEVKDSDGSMNEWIPWYNNDITNFRVKYLDKEDIESLGWEEEISAHFVLITDKGRYFLDCNFASHKFQISTDIQKYPNEQTYPIKFNGKIKNKSELKKLMQQLDIIKK